MKRRNLRKGFTFIFIFIAVAWSIGCGDMVHTNPLDPKNPNYKPPFTSIAIQSDLSKTVWFGSDGGGLVKFDGSAWSKYTTSNGLPDDRIQAVASQGDNLWFITSRSNREIYRFDGAQAKSYAMAPIVSISANEDDTWVGTQNEVSVYDPNIDSFVGYQLPSGGQLISLFWDGLDLWTAIGRGTLHKLERAEVLSFTVQNGRWESQGYFPLVEGESLSAIALDGDLLWGGTSRGDVRSFQLSRPANLRTQVGISPRGLWPESGCMAVDDDFVWFGSRNLGLVRYHKSSGKRESFFSGQRIYGVAATNQHIWAVTDTGAQRYERSSGAWKLYEYPTSAP